jgi:outer membrane lipoprotein
MLRWFIVLVAPLVLTACPAPPPAITNDFAPIDPAEVREQRIVGERVRWGGLIVSVQPAEAETCFEILHRPLDAQARPRITDTTGGRFLACAPGFYDPAAYPAGREITATGVLQEPATLRIGEFRYQAPRVQIERLHLWPERVARVPPYYRDPFWDPWYRWDPWYPWHRWPYRSPFHHPFYW